MIRHSKISKYEIKELLGEGGMGMVYKAFDIENNNYVALKVLLKNMLQNSDIKTRFTREASAGMKMSHLNIVKIFEIGEADGELFIAMEFVEGRTLRQILREKVLEAPEVIDIAVSVCKALSEAHKLNIIHRDIKSDNIMINADGEVKVMDFGLAKIQDASVLTREASVLGTLSYMSPQQAIGEAIDHRSDIFSLGVVMYELLTGNMPFNGDYEMAVIYSILNEEPLSLREINDRIPKPIEQIVFKALKKDINQRYQSTDELIEDLKKVKLQILETQNSSFEINLYANEEKSRVEERGFTSPLAGREEQFRLLKNLLHQAAMGDGKAALIAGEAGIGKTRIILELEKHARTLKTRMLQGKCLLMQAGYPYLPFIDAIRNYFDIKGIESSEKLKEFINEQQNELSDLLPVMEIFLNIKSNHKSIVESKDQFWDAIFRLFIIISKERPLIIFIDDLHWADEDTLNLFYYLARNTSNSKIMMIGTYRPEDLIFVDDVKLHPLKQIQYELNREGLLLIIELARLKYDDIKKITSSIFSQTEFPDNFFELLINETEGNPFFVIETLKLLVSENIIEKTTEGYILKQDFEQFALPAKVHDVVMRRIERLNESDREILEVASVEGESFRSGMLVECLQLSKIKLLKKLQSLERDHHIIHPADKKYRFDHAKIREALYAEISPELKTEYHLLIGSYLSDYFGSDEIGAPEIANHFLLGGDSLKAFPFILTAAERSKILFANEMAIKYYNKALEIIKTNRHNIDKCSEKEEAVLEGLADVLTLTGNHSVALAHYTTLQNKIFSALKLSELLRKIASVYIATGNTEKAHNYLNLAQKNLKAYSLENETAGLFNSDEHTVLQSTLGKIKITLANLYKLKGRYHLAIKEIEEGLTLLGDEGNSGAKSQAYNNLGNIYYDKGEYIRAEEMYLKSLELREKISDKKGIGEAYNNLSNVFYEQGNYDKSAEMMEKSLKIMNEIGFRIGIAGSYNNLGTIYQDQGKYEKALEMHIKSLLIREEIGDMPGIVISKANLGYINLEMQQFIDANKQLTECLKLMKELDLQVYEPQTRVWYSQSLAELGEYSSAKQMALSALKLARELNQRSSEAFALRTLSIIELRQIQRIENADIFNWDEIYSYLIESLEIFKELKMEHEIGRSYLEIAAFHRYKNSVVETEKFTSLAREIFSSLGAEGDLVKTEKINLSTIH